MTKTIDKSILWNIIERSKKEPELAPQAATAITKLNEMGEDFSGKDLSGVNIPGADLKNAEMEGVDFTGANLKGVRFVQANLKKVNFNAAHMSGVVFIEGVEIKGHERAITKLEFSPNMKYIASVASRDKNIKLWDVNTGSYIRSFEGHTAAINSIKFSTDEELMVSGSNDNTAVLWEITTGKILQRYIGHTNWVKDALFTSDKVIATCSLDNSVRCWSTEAEKQLTVLQSSDVTPISLSYSDTNKVLAVGAQDSRIVLIQIEDKKTINKYKLKSNWASQVMFSPDETKLVILNIDGGIREIDMAGDTIKEYIDSTMNRGIADFGFDKSGNILTIRVEDKKIKLQYINHSSITSAPIDWNDANFGEQDFSTDCAMLALGNEVGQIRIYALNETLSYAHLNKAKRQTLIVDEADFTDAKALCPWNIRILSKTTAKNYLVDGQEKSLLWRYQHQGMEQEAFEEWIYKERKRTRLVKIATTVINKLQAKIQYDLAVSRGDQEVNIEFTIKNITSILEEVGSRCEFFDLALDDNQMLVLDDRLTTILYKALKTVAIGVCEEAQLKEVVDQALKTFDAAIMLEENKREESAQKIKELEQELTITKSLVEKLSKQMKKTLNAISENNNRAGAERSVESKAGHFIADTGKGIVQGVAKDQGSKWVNAGMSKLSGK